ncbi:Crp/Fnr family transcriptional regulator [Flavicella sediminum]|uniref:Crp/Fnr family transcriptional regulator n=1 Tax=Flavicella sediminum TaxID=2585141 RepID=UPI001123C42D|nr:Crp/Fnr family transcriptional regulator [Flavicella sediminum]
MADCIHCENLNCLIKKNSKDPKIEDFLKNKHTIKCKKSQQFIMEGTPAHGLFFAYKGKVKVAKTGINDREQIVRFAKDGEIIGHRGGFGSSKYYSISAQALEDTTLCYFSKDDLKNILLTIPSLTFDFMLFYADELSESETRVRKLAQMSVRERVIDTLLYMDKKFGSTDQLLNVLLSRKDYADYSGTTEEQVIRILSTLKKEGLVNAKGRKLGILNHEALREEISKHTFSMTR